MKKKVRGFLASVLSTLMLLSLAACTTDFYYPDDDNLDEVQETTVSAEEEAKKTVETFFTSLVQRNKQAADNCIKYDFESVENNMESSKNDPATNAMKEHFLDTFKYEINDIEKADSETVIVTVSLDTVDMTAVLPEYIKYAIEISSSAEFDESFTQEKLNEALESYMTSLLTSSETSRKNIELAVEVEKDDSAWFINADEKFFDAITGGMITAGKKLNESNY